MSESNELLRSHILHRHHRNRILNGKPPSQQRHLASNQRGHRKQQDGACCIDEYDGDGKVDEVDEWSVLD